MMTHYTIKKHFVSAVNSVTADISKYVGNPDKDMTRRRKLPPDVLISFLVSQGASNTKNELLDFFKFDVEKPSASAAIQQRSKLKPNALETVLKRFNKLVSPQKKSDELDFIAVDGSTFSFFSKPSLASEEYFVSPGSSAKGVYSMHLNAFYNLKSRTYSDAIIQPIHSKDEYKAFCTMVDRYDARLEHSVVFIGDRGYCSYNNMAHVINKGQYFLFRAKDIHSKGITKGFDYPDSESFDITVNVSLVRSHSKKIHTNNENIRFIDKATSFDFIEYGTTDTYDLSFRIVRFSLSEKSYECIVTNLPADKFPPEAVKKIYGSRWGIETSFRKLKYTIGLSSFHSYKPEYIMQEIWAKMTAYNITETLINNTVITTGKTKHAYQADFSAAAHICKTFIRLTTNDPMDVPQLIRKHLTPIRNEREYSRLQTAHFRRPRYFLYRAA